MPIQLCQPYFHWINGGDKGVDFVANINLPHVDYARYAHNISYACHALCSIHVYPDNWEIPVEEFDWVNVNFIQDRAALAHAAGKPIIVEEFGVRADYHPKGRCVHGTSERSGL